MEYNRIEMQLCFFLLFFPVDPLFVQPFMPEWESRDVICEAILV